MRIIRCSLAQHASVASSEKRNMKFETLQKFGSASLQSPKEGVAKKSKNRCVTFPPPPFPFPLLLHGKPV